MRNGKTVCQRNVSDSCMRVSAPPSRLIHGAHHVAQERKRRPRGIQTAEPSAQRGRIGHTIGIFDRGRRSFPGATFHEVASQRLTAGDQAVVAYKAERTAAGR